MRVLTIDCEIKKAILSKGAHPIPGIEYVDPKGGSPWDQKDQMGISVLCAHSSWDDNVHVIMEDNVILLEQLIGMADKVVGWNNNRFDDPLLEITWGVKVPQEKKLDWLVETWRGHGLGPDFVYPSHLGFSLEAMALSNFGVRKLNNGADAPILWQQGKLGELISYCINDVQLTERLGHLIVAGTCISPKTGEKFGWGDDE